MSLFPEEDGDGRHAVVRNEMETRRTRRAGWPGEGRGGTSAAAVH